MHLKRRRRWRPLKLGVGIILVFGMALALGEPDHLAAALSLALIYARTACEHRKIERETTRQIRELEDGSDLP